MKKGLVVSTVVSILAAAASIIAKVYFAAQRDSIIVAKGIVHYRQMNSLLLTVMCIFIVLSVVFVLIAFLRAQKIRRQTAQKEAESYEKEQMQIRRNKEKESYLSASSRLEEQLLREELKKAASGEWRGSAGDIQKLFDQSVKMDTYQEKLDKLIKKNGADALDDTEEVLEKAEQYLLQNIRKTLNYMDVLDAGTEADAARVTGFIQKAVTDNETILSSVSDFLLSVTEYLNSQGSTDGLEMLNSYKQVLISSLQTDTKESALKM